MESMKKSKIVSVNTTEINKQAPILATFQNAPLNEEIACNSVCKRVQTESNGRKYALIATESNVYKSDITDADNQLQDTYIAIHNKKTKEIKLIQVIESSFKHVLYDDTRSRFEQNILDSRKLLAKEFAGKKGAAAFERSQRTKVNSSILEDTVDNMLTTLDTDKFFENDISKQPQEEQEKFREYIFPKVNMRSTNDPSAIREIFTIDNLIGDEIIDHLSEVAIDILNLDPKNLPFTNTFLRSSVMRIQTSKQPDSVNNLKKMAMLIYAQSLISIINSSQKYINPSELSKFSNQLANDLITKFFTPGSKHVSNFSKQKSIVFYVVLVLLASDNLEVNFNDILDSVNLSKKELLKYVSVIGCKAKGDILSLHKVTNLDKNATFQVPLMTSKKDKRKN